MIEAHYVTKEKLYRHFPKAEDHTYFELIEAHEILKEITRHYVQDPFSPELLPLRTLVLNTMRNERLEDEWRSSATLRGLVKALELPAAYGFDSIAFLSNLPSEYLHDCNILTAEITIYFTRAIFFLQPIKDAIKNVVRTVETLPIDLLEPTNLFELMQEIWAELTYPRLVSLPGFSLDKVTFVNLEQTFCRIQQMYANAPLVWVATSAVLLCYFNLIPLLSDDGKIRDEDIDPAVMLDRLKRSAVTIERGEGRPNIFGSVVVTRKDFVEIDWEYLQATAEVMRTTNIPFDCESIHSLGQKLSMNANICKTIANTAAQYYRCA